MQPARMKKFSASRHSSLSELNITPLLDLVFVLLVIFIITTPQLTNDLELNLPSAGPKPPPSQRPRINYVMIDVAGNITFNNQPYTVETLKQAMIVLRTQDPDPSVVVKGHQDVEYQKVIGVLDILQQADVTKIGLATDVAAAPAAH